MLAASQTVNNCNKIIEATNEVLFSAVRAQVEIPLRNKLNEIIFRDPKTKKFFTENLRGWPTSFTMLEYLVNHAYVYALHRTCNQDMLAFTQHEIQLLKQQGMTSIAKMVTEIHKNLKPLGCYMYIDKEYKHVNKDVVLVIRLGPVITEEGKT